MSHIDELKELGMYHDEEWWQKKETELMRNIGAALEGFNMYGLGDLIPGATKELLKLAVDFSEIVRGVDKTLDIERIRKGK